MKLHGNGPLLLRQQCQGPLFFFPCLALLSVISKHSARAGEISSQTETSARECRVFTVLFVAFLRALERHCLLCR